MDLMYSKDPNIWLYPKICKVKINKNLTLNYTCFEQYNTEHEEISNFIPKQDEPSTSTIAPYTDNESDLFSCSHFDEDYDIVITKSKNFMTKFYVPEIYYPIIIGFKGTMKKRLQTETATKILIPKRGETGDIIITGKTERSVASARTRINMLIIQKRDKHPATHFLSLPIFSELIQKNFCLFKNNILSLLPIRGVDETIFQNPNKLHMTIVTLVLLDETEIENASTVLYNAEYYFIRPVLKNIGSIRLKVEGIEIMNDDPSEVDVLYGKVSLINAANNSEFQKLVNDIADYFARKGVTKRQQENVKLHITLMNSLFRKNENIDERKQKRETFDATKIIEKYGNFYFGEVNIDELHFSIRFTTAKNLYYEAVSQISLKPT